MDLHQQASLMNKRCAKFVCASAAHEVCQKDRQTKVCPQNDNFDGEYDNFDDEYNRFNDEYDNFSSIKTKMISFGGRK